MHPPRGSRAAYAGCSSGEEIDREIGLELIEPAGRSTRGKPRASPLKPRRKSRRQRAPPATSSTGIPYHLLLVVGVLTFVGAAALISFNQVRHQHLTFAARDIPEVTLCDIRGYDRTQLNELQAAGFSIPDLRAEGFTDAQLLAAGYSAIDLISPPLSANPPPHLPPEPLAIGATELVTELNARYTLGKPSSAVADAGVLVHQGVGGELGRQSSRPAFTQAAPALLGLDDTLFEYCSELLGIQASYDGPEGGFNSKLAHRCVQANHNILRLTSARVPWSMCQTLQWLMCAARGQLPGQQSPTLHFAIAPK
ncbi:MAG: hypothetical protein SGPRY_000253, partial [Prymnesium sp.]